MSLRWRKNGQLICGANSKSESGDTYINDRLHYKLVVSGFIIEDKNIIKNNLWHWEEK